MREVCQVRYREGFGGGKREKRVARRENLGVVFSRPRRKGRARYGCRQANEGRRLRDREAAGGSQTGLARQKKNLGLDVVAGMTGEGKQGGGFGMPLTSRVERSMGGSAME